MTRMKIVTRVAALALFVAACSSGGSSSKPVPGAPVVNAPPSATNQNPYNLSGTGEANATVAVRGGAQPVATGTVDANGQFSVLVPLKPNQKNTLIVSLSNASGEGQFATVEVVHDGQAPDTPVLDPVVSPSRVATQHLHGKAEAGSLVKITGGKMDVTGQAGADGHFDIEVPLNSQASGKTENTLKVTATDVAGNTSTPAMASIEVDPSLPVQAPQLDPQPSATNQAMFPVTGKAEAGAGISIVGGMSPKSGTADADGHFTVTVPLKLNQQNTLLVFAIGNGVTSDPATLNIIHDDVAPAAPTVNDPATPTGGKQVSITGSAEPKALVTITGGKMSASSPVDEFGNFTVIVTLKAAAGAPTENDLSIVVTDAAGNASPAVTKKVVQDPNLEQPITVDPVQSPTQSLTVTLTGSTQANATVNVAGGAQPASTMSGEDGHFSVDVQLTPNTSNDLHVSRDGGTMETIVTIVHDDIPPETPVLNAVASPTNRLNIDISGASEAGAHISVTGASAPATTTADANGLFSVPVTLKADTTSTIVVVAADRASNVSNPATLQVTQSSSVPDAPIIDQTNPAPTKNTTYTVTGRVTKPGNGISIEISGASAPANGPTDASNGTFSIDVQLTPDSANELHIKSKNGEIESPDAVVTVVQDGTAPSAPDASKISLGSTGCSILGRSTASVTGAAGAVEAASTVKIVNTSNNNATVTVAASSQGSFTKSISLCSGEVLKISAIDAAGNESAVTTKTAQ